MFSNNSGGSGEANSWSILRRFAADMTLTERKLKKLRGRKTTERRSGKSGEELKSALPPVDLAFCRNLIRDDGTVLKQIKNG